MVYCTAKINWCTPSLLWYYSVQFSCSIMSWLPFHGLQNARPPCPSPTHIACSNSCPSSWVNLTGHLMWRTDSLEKTLMLGKIKGRRRRGWQRMGWLDSNTDLMNMSLSRLWEWVMDREAWHAAVHGVAKIRTDWVTELTEWIWHFPELVQIVCVTVHQCPLVSRHVLHSRS